MIRFADRWTKTGFCLNKQKIKETVAFVQLHRAIGQYEQFEAAANPLTGPQQHQIHFRTGKFVFNFFFFLIPVVKNSKSFHWWDWALQETVAETLEELWISYNQIEKLKGIGYMKKLRVLTMSNNNVREWVEFGRLAELPALKEAVFIGSPPSPPPPFYLDRAARVGAGGRGGLAGDSPAIYGPDGESLAGNSNSNTIGMD